MSPKGFEPAIPAREGQQTYALDRAATEMLLQYRSKTLLLKNYCNYNNAHPRQRETHLPNMIIAFTLALQQSINISEDILGSNKINIIVSLYFIVTFKLWFACEKQLHKMTASFVVRRSTSAALISQ
jgi:hypothetical protein